MPPYPFHIPAIATAALLPVALPAAYLFLLNWRLSKKTSAISGRRLPSAQSSGSSSPSLVPIPTPVTLPPGVASDGSEWILAYERVVSHPVPESTLAHSAPAISDDSSSAQSSSLVTNYVRAVQVAFSWTPQSFAIQSLIKEPAIRRTFDTNWINTREFQPGELVNGIWIVTHRGGPPDGTEPVSERVECAIKTPTDYTGTVVRALIVGGVELVGKEKGENEVVFVNETWMWRKRSEKPSMIEGGLGSWLHTLLARWLISKGMAAVLEE